MRRLVFACLIVGCGGGGSPGEPSIDAPLAEEEPQICKDHCVSPTPVNDFGDCCDSVTCYVDPTTHHWEVTYCDPPPPTCADCASDQICVQSFDGTCGGGTPRCVQKTVACPQNACTPDCQAAYCNAPYQCEDRAPCGTEDPAAFTCYGP